MTDTEKPRRGTMRIWMVDSNGAGLSGDYPLNKVVPLSEFMVANAPKRLVMDWLEVASDMEIER